MDLQLRQFVENHTEFIARREGWRLLYTIGRDVNGRSVITSLRIEVDRSSVLRKPAPAGGINGALLHKLRLGEERAGAAWIIAFQRFRGVAATPVTGKGRPPKYSLAFYRKVAKRYKELKAKNRRDVTDVLAAEFGFTRAGMLAMISRCRHRLKLLPQVG